ncbi:protein artichoke-like [Chrysoperla carnea]|uniref:protein artichoke-like n=1 Tax=Chrysoperla carnea TaxID=189513 RepID=UPI001D0850A8|nr:protein artichoke-like [Chrysoperla carnea]
MPALIYLDLSGNHLKSLPSKMFEGNVQLRVLNMSQNSISNILRDTFARLPDLIELNLENNQLTVIKNIFTSLTQLEEIHLVGNQIKEIEPNTFEENVNLKRVHLGYNPLSDLKPDTFRSDTSRIANTYVPFQSPSATITELNLGLCSFKILKDHYFLHLRRLKLLNIQSNEISEFESNDVFKDNIRLEHLRLSYNNIKELPPGIFSPLRNLQFLTLRYNQITDLPRDLFKRNSKLKELHLSYNEISKLNSEVFKYLKKLNHLNLEGNALTSVPKDVFVHLTELKELFLTRNQITYVEPGSFDSLVHLKTLMLYQNELKQLEPNLFFKLIELNSLSLKANGVTDIQYGTFNSFHDGYSDESSRILDLDLSGSNLTHLSYNIFAPLSRLISLDISFSSVKTIDFDFFKSMGDTLQILILAANKIAKLQVGIFDNLDNVNHLDLHRNLLQTIDGELFKNMLSLEKLDLSENMLASIPSELFNIPRLFEVRLNENQLIYLSPEIFEGEDCSVERLHLHGNRLTFFDKDFLQRSKLKFLRLGFNPWQCSCLNEIMNDIYRLNIEFHPVDYFDGTNPVCVVSMNETCTRETYLSDDCLKQYKSVKHSNVIRTVDWKTKIQIFSGLILILNIKNITSECERINIANRSIAKCYYSNLQKLNALQDKDLYTELESISGIIRRLEKNAIAYPKLSALKLSGNGIQNIESEAFRNIPSLTYLDLSYNQLKSLPSKMFEGNVQLRVLNISHNAITNILRETFARLPDLVQLNLGQNRLTIIKNIFTSLTQLKEINLSGNLIEDIESNTFLENVNLKRVDLDGNPISQLKPDSFRSDLSGIATKSSLHSSSILELNFARCNFKVLKNDFFLHLRRLKTLRIYANAISDFESDDIFKDTVRLEHLNLSYNNIKSLPSGILRYLRNLLFLSLHQNQITDLPENLFERNAKLKDLFLSYNQISKLNANVFRYLKKLNFLTLEGNALTSVPKDVFVHLTNLKELFLTRNQITYIEPGSFDNLIHLKTLMLYQNQLKQLEPNIFSKLVELNKLSLSSNGVTDIQEGAFNGFHEGYTDESSRILNLDLSGSNLTHLSSYMLNPLSRLISLDVSYSKVKTMDSDLFKAMGNTLQILKLGGNKIEELKLGIFDDLENVNLLELNKNLIKTIDGELFKDMLSLEKLDLSGNMLASIPNELFNIPQLFEVKLDENQLIDLSPEIFEGEDCYVERLHLHGNRLTFFDKDFLQRSKLKFLRFGRNPWQCSCLNEIMNDIYRLNIEIYPVDYFDGTNPVCVVTMNHTCSRETHLTEDLLKQYKSVYQPNIIRTIY